MANPLIVSENIDLQLALYNSLNGDLRCGKTDCNASQRLQEIDNEITKLFPLANAGQFARLQVIRRGLEELKTIIIQNQQVPDQHVPTPGSLSPSSESATSVTSSELDQRSLSPSSESATSVTSSELDQYRGTFMAIFRTADGRHPTLYYNGSAKVGDIKRLLIADTDVGFKTSDPDKLRIFIKSKELQNEQTFQDFNPQMYGEILVLVKG